jgi:hypothetical protein
MAEQDQNPLSAQLADSSAAFALSALRAQHQDRRVFLLHAATALEHLAKAVLARRHPSLIVASNDFESLLHACGEGASARRKRPRMRTINASDAISRAGRFLPTVEALAPSLELLIQVRNGVAHLGEVSADDADSVLVPYLKASEEMRAALDIDKAAYWGEFVDLVDSALEEKSRRCACKSSPHSRTRARSSSAASARSTRQRVRRCCAWSQRATRRRSTTSSCTSAQLAAPKPSS